MGFSSLSSNDIFSPFDDPIKEDTFNSMYNHDDAYCLWNMQASQGASPASLGTSPESNELLSSSPSTSTDSAFNDVRETEAKKSKTPRVRSKEDSSAKKSLKCLAKQNDAAKGQELQKHLKKASKTTTNNKSAQRNTVNASSQEKDSKIKAFTVKFGQKNPNPRKTILLEHVPPTAAFSKSPTKSAKNARSSSLNLEKPQAATKAKTENEQKGSRNPPQDHDYCKRNLSDIIEKDYKEADKTQQQECKKKAKAPKKRKMTLSEYLQDKKDYKEADKTRQQECKKKAKAPKM